MKLIIRRGDQDHEVLLVRTVVVGRDPLCSVSAEDPLLSRRHAEFVRTGSGVRVRDLGSQNGIKVNGIDVRETTLRAGDVVHIASLQIRLVDDDGPAAATSPSTDGGTKLMASPPTSPTPVLGSNAPIADSAPASAGESSAPRTTTSAEAVHMTSADGPFVAASGAAPVPGAAAAARSEGKAADARPARHRRRLSWTVRTVLTSVLAAVLVFLAVAVPAVWWHRNQIAESKEAHARAVANWLAADAANRLATGQMISEATDAVRREPGISEALVVSLDGRVLSPGTRAGQRIESFPAFRRTAASVDRQQVAEYKGTIEVVQPVNVPGTGRGAVAWVVAGAEGTSTLAVLVATLLMACLLGLGAGRLISRDTTQTLSAMTEDLDAMVAGQVSAVRDPLGTRTTRELAETMNYLVTRLRPAGDDFRRPVAAATQPAQMAPPIVAPAAPPADATVQVPPSWSKAATVPDSKERRRADAKLANVARPRTEFPEPRADNIRVAPGLVPVAESSAAAAFRPRPGDARIVANAQFRVTEASPECETLIGATPERMVGQHLLDVISDPQLVESLLQGLSALKPRGEQMMHVETPGRPGRLLMWVHRSGKDAPIMITLRDEESGKS